MKLKNELIKSNNLSNTKGYFDSYRDNIYQKRMSLEFQEMFDEGSGNELHSKAEAIHSSSMLGYNFFHWICEDNPFEFCGATYKKVLFEVKLRTLKCRSNPANMDIVLIGTKENRPCILFVESKFLEYSNKTKFDLKKESYCNENNWYDQDVDWNGIISSVPKRPGYLEGIKQTITHLFGIHYELINKSNSSRYDIINLDNCLYEFANFIFEPDTKYEESTAYELYKEIYADFSKNLVDKHLKVSPKWYSYSEIWKEMQTQIDDELKTYLYNKYIKFAK